MIDKFFGGFARNRSVEIYSSQFSARVFYYPFLKIPIIVKIKDSTSAIKLSSKLKDQYTKYLMSSFIFGLFISLVNSGYFFVVDSFSQDVLISLNIIFFTFLGFATYTSFKRLYTKPIILKWHGAEHKLINLYGETGLHDITLAKKSSMTARRCGTTFNIFVFFITFINLLILVGQAYSIYSYVIWICFWVAVFCRYINQRHVEFLSLLLQPIFAVVSHCKKNF